MRVRPCKMKTIQFNKFYILHVVILGRMQYVLYLVQLQSFHTFFFFMSASSPEHLFHPLALQSVRFPFCLSDSRPLILNVPDLLLTLEFFFASLFTFLPQTEVVASSSDVTLW